MAEVTVELLGMKALQKELRAVDKELPKGLRKGLNRAADIVIREAKPGIPTVTGRAKGSLKAASTPTAVRIRAGSAKAPYYPWLDFGGTIPSGAKRPFVRSGRYIYPALGRRRDEVIEAVRVAVVEAVEAAGLELD